MSIRYRPMEPKDARPCAEITARHPGHGPRYGSAIRHLAPAWLKLLGSDGFVGAVFEELQGRKTTLLGAGIGTFVTDHFISDLKAAPHFWIGPELALRLSCGESPVLSQQQVRDANSSSGLNIAVWQTGVLPEDMLRAEVANAIMAAFVEMHRGFRLKETVTQTETVVQGRACAAAGGLLWDDGDGNYCTFEGASVERLMQRPHVIGLSRDLALRSPGSWNASMFLSYRPPRLGFTCGEQRLLSCGLTGRTDEEIGCQLGISLAAVRKAWKSIYDRAGKIEPDFVVDSMRADRDTGERGKEKKQRLLAYMREHPEELRPISRKALQLDASQMS